MEFHNSEKIAEYKQRYGIDGKNIIVSSDAHYLTDIAEEGFAVELADDPYSSDRVRNLLIDHLLGLLKGGETHG